ncbi:MAG: UvrD-helicase domain-containing protein [Brasilonema sp.]
MKKDRNYYRSLNWSTYQRRIFQEVTRGERHITVEASAGAGKTTTIKGICHWLPSSAKIRIFAFNRSIADKLAAELPGRVKVATAHSYGYALCMRAMNAYEGDLTVDQDKYWKLASSRLQRLMREAERSDGGNYPELGSEKVNRTLIKAVYDTCHIIRVALPEFRFQDVREAITAYGVIMPSSLRYWAVRLAMDCIVEGNAQTSERKIIDFDDMLWLPHLCRLRPLSRVDYCMIDESQDTTAVSHSLYRKFVEDGARLVAIGDTHQCQPTGTMVMMSSKAGGGFTPIEKLKVGDSVRSYDRRGATYSVGTITEIASKPYEGEMIKITVGGNVSYSTPNHKWMVRWTKDFEDLDIWITYLMRRGNYYRIGQTKMFRKASSKQLDRRRGMFGLVMRAHIENADAAWVLGVHSSLPDALINEATYSALFGLPQTVFSARPCIGLTQELVDQMYEVLQPQRPRAEACLKAFGRDINYPIWQKETLAFPRQRQGRTTIFETQACNLMSDFMEIVVVPRDLKNIKTNHVYPDGTYKFKYATSDWQKIKVEREYYQGIVYSLNVEKFHKYVSDGLVTCNSINLFAGSMPDAFPRIKAEFNCLELSLPVTYRCPSSHVALAQQLVPSIQAKSNAIRGIIRTVDQDFFVENVQPPDLVLARHTAPLIQMCIRLVLGGHSALVRGNDIGEGLCKTARQVCKQYPLLRFLNELHV